MSEKNRRERVGEPNAKADRPSQRRWQRDAVTEMIKHLQDERRRVRIRGGKGGAGTKMSKS